MVVEPGSEEVMGATYREGKAMPGVPQDLVEGMMAVMPMEVAMVVMGEVMVGKGVVMVVLVVLVAMVVVEVMLKLEHLQVLVQKRPLEVMESKIICDLFKTTNSEIIVLGVKLRIIP